jgi:hypothetical protein
MKTQTAAGRVTGGHGIQSNRNENMCNQKKGGKGEGDTIKLKTSKRKRKTKRGRRERE